MSPLKKHGKINNASYRLLSPWAWSQGLLPRITAGIVDRRWSFWAPYARPRANKWRQVHHREPETPEKLRFWLSHGARYVLRKGMESQMISARD